jgi:hypothetical protein
MRQFSVGGWGGAGAMPRVGGLAEDICKFLGKEEPKKEN